MNTCKNMAPETKFAFISQPMNGRSASFLQKQREDVIKKLTERGYIVIDSIFDQDEEPDRKNRPLWCLGRSLEIMSCCDLVYMMKEWRIARGCKIEHDCAKAYGIEIEYEDLRKPN